MTVIPIARYLVQFGKGDDFEATDQRRDAAPQLRSLDPRAAEELAQKLEEAHGRGQEEGRAAAWAELDLKLADERARHEERIASERETWLADEGQRMSGGIGSAFQELEASIADSVARILKPFLAAALREQVLAELAETLTALLAGEHTLLKVSGPESLLKALRERMGAHLGCVEYAPSGGLDVSVVADHTVVESRLQAWIDRFHQAIEA